MDLTRHDDLEAFYAHAQRFLLQREAEHNLILGITIGLIRDGVPAELRPYLATVQDDGRVVAAAMRTPPHKLVVSADTSDRAPLRAAGRRTAC
jgi:hypothetical protein